MVKVKKKNHLSLYIIFLKMLNIQYTVCEYRYFKYMIYILYMYQLDNISVNQCLIYV